MLPAINYSDPRLQPGALASLSRTDDRIPRLVEVVECVIGRVTVLDCWTETLCRITPMVFLRDWRLVREAPTAPNLPPESED